MRTLDPWLSGIRKFFSTLFGSSTSKIESEPLEPLSPRILVMVFDPIIDPTTGLRLRQDSRAMKWNSVDNLLDECIEDIDQCSAGLVKYRAIERLGVDTFPLRMSGKRYDAATYLDILDTPPEQRRGKLDEQDFCDYRAIVDEFNLLHRVAAGDFDEVWMFGFPFAGFYESRMIGKGAFPCNSAPLENTSGRRFVMMGFNYERGVGEMLESVGHRAEDILKKVFERTRGDANLIERFTRYDRTALGRAEVGTIHFGPNSDRPIDAEDKSDRDWTNLRFAPSRCDDWLNFPDFQNVVRQINCTEWRCEIRGHHRWWLTHLPKVAGRLNGISNNWWKYVADPNNVKA